MNLESLVAFPFAHVPPTLSEATITELNADCLRWAEKHGIITDDAARHHFTLTEPARCAATGYPGAPLERLRPIAYWFTWLFPWDDAHADDTTDHQGAAAAVVNVLDVLDGADPVDAWSTALADCFGLICDTIPSYRHPRIATGFREWMLGVALQHATTPTDVRLVRSALRFITVGSLLTALIEPSLGINVPSYEHDDPDARRMIWHASHNLNLVNDAVSAGVEKHEANPWNTVLTYAAAHDSGIDEGIADAARRANEHARAFEDIASKRLTPDHAPTGDLAQFIAGMRALMTGNWEWASSVARYRQ